MYKKSLAGVIIIGILAYLCVIADWSYWGPYWFDKGVNLCIAIAGGAVAGFIASIAFSVWTGYKQLPDTIQQAFNILDMWIFKND